MCSNKIANKIINEKFRFLDEYKINLLCEIAQYMQVPKDILVGIYYIETFYRPLHIRIIEYLVTISSLLVNLLFKIPIKNYTIGLCQIGLSTILAYKGKQIYKHDRYIKKINIKDMISIVKSIYFREHFAIFGQQIKIIYTKSTNISDSWKIVLRIVGEEYNGRYAYGLLLEEVVCMLERTSNSTCNIMLNGHSG